MKRMKAAVVTRYGGPGVMEILLQTRPSSGKIVVLAGG